MIQENQIFIGLFIALINGIFALRLGIAMYKRS
jgi:photosystem I reaction center subunit XII